MPISSTSDASGLYVAIGLAFDPWCFGHSLLQLSASLHPAARSALVFLIASVIVYRRHRSMHMSDWLWRTLYLLHQQPHSALGAIRAGMSRLAASRSAPGAGVRHADGEGLST